ncbi:RNA polymerase sigma factor [Ornithinibacillus scapharcae]|uniref:RNA polymerase sigma factor n=1 Tax=Ornithinibacillus scapharcae TaxID=1147159 RepID=UPI000225BC3D|nr:RNA polymerase sigma factor [Ornithinibacillus scapharcae]
MVSLDITELYTMYYHRLLHIGYSVTKDRYLAEDVVQETFIKVMNHFDTIQDEQKLYAWLTVITRRTAIDLLRSQQKDKALSTEQEMLVNLESGNVQSVEAEVELAWLLEEVNKKIHNLNGIYHEVMTLKVKHEMKEREIANRLDVKLSLVKTRIHRARKYLKEDLQEQLSA